MFGLGDSQQRCNVFTMVPRGRSLQVFDAGWSSLVARRAHNPKVVSSNLAPATKYLIVGAVDNALSDWCWAISS